MALVGCLLFFAGPIPVAAQCAYPALELLDFDYVNSPHMTQIRSDEHTPRHVCLTSPIRQTDNQGAVSSGIEYEFEGRLLVIDTLLRWLDLDATAEAWTSLPSFPRSE